MSSHPLHPTHPGSAAHVARLRALCEALPEVTEKIAWGTPTWRGYDDGCSAAAVSPSAAIGAIGCQSLPTTRQRLPLRGSQSVVASS